MAPAVRDDDIRVFSLPLKDGHVFLYNLEEGGYWVRQALDHRQQYSGIVVDALAEAITGAE